MAAGANNDSMLPFACVLGQNQMRRSLTGALATDPIVPERPGSPFRPSRAGVPNSKFLGLGAGRRTTQPSEGAQRA
jgi:hypothetical protein